MPALSLKKLIIICALVTLTGIALLLTLLIPEEVGILQIIICAFILLCWPIGILTNYFLKNRKPKAANSGAMEAPQTSSSLAPSREYEELSRGAEETVQFLRSGNLGNREVSDPVYSLPWYLLAGPPNSGKTSLALSAGLNFNALSSQRRADQNLVRATRDCDWRVTDNAVIVDTAGRYLTEGQDRDEWLGVLATLKKYRKNRALDGFVLTVNAANILSANEAEIEQQAQVLRARIDEVIKSTGVRFPVYLVFTHSDSIPGFKEFFAAPPNEQAQVWGATIPLEQSNTAHALFDVEFDYLLDALMRRRITRLSGTTSAGEQHGIFNFPLRFAETRRKLGFFTLALFRPNPFSELPLLRGFYFTSNNLGADGRINGTGTFSEDLFKQVIFRDQDIAASFQSKKAAPNKLANVKLAVGALAAACALWFGGTVLSFFNNNAMLAQAQEHAKRVLDHYEAGRGKVKVEPDELTDLDKLRGTLQEIDESDESFFGSLSQRFGLYSGGKVRHRVHQVYFDFVAQRFLAPALTKLTQDLKTTVPGGDGEALEKAQDDYYYKLATYLMLEKQERVDASFLTEKLRDYWPEELKDGKQANLAFYAAQAALHDDDDDSVPRPLAAPELIGEARNNLKNYTATKRAYHALIRKINNLGEPIELSKLISGLEGSDWLSGSTSPPVPYAFTKRAYYKHIAGSAMANVVSELKDDWVIGRKDGDPVDLAELQRRYADKFIANWGDFLQQIKVRDFNNPGEAARALNELGKESGPLKTILAEAARQGNLAEPPTNDGAIAWLKGILTSKVIGNKKIEDGFKPLLQFTTSPAWAAYQTKLGELRGKLDSNASDWKRVEDKLRTDEGFKSTLAGVVGTIEALKNPPSPVGTAAFDLLKKPNDSIDKALGKSSGDNLGDAWAILVKKINDFGYPFGTGADVSPLQFAEVFNPADGLVKAVFDKISNDFQGTPGQLTPRNPADYNPVAVAFFNNTFKAQEAFFTTKGKAPMFDYGFTITVPASKKAEVTVDGSPVTAAARPPWPAAGSNVGIVIKVTDNTPAATASPSPTPDLTPPLRFDGPWGIFKLVKARGNNFNVSGVSIKIDAPPNNPFTIDFGKLRAPASLKTGAAQPASAS